MEAIQFSGGKDSLAVLYLFRDRLKEIPVYFGDTGMVYPHMLKFVRDTCAKLGAELRIVKPPVTIEEFHSRLGLPSDIVPVEAMQQMRIYSRRTDGVMLQSSLSCCGTMLWNPMQKAMYDDNIRVVIRGSKRADGHVGVPDGYKDDRGVVYSSPLWEWTDDDVFSYLAEVGAELPEHYAAVNNSFDCLLCTAFLSHPGARERLEFTKRRYPKEWPLLEARLRQVRDAIDAGRDEINDALSILEAESP